MKFFSGDLVDLKLLHPEILFFKVFVYRETSPNVLLVSFAQGFGSGAKAGADLRERLSHIQIVVFKARGIFLRSHPSIIVSKSWECGSVSMIFTSCLGELGVTPGV